MRLARDVPEDAVAVARQEHALDDRLARGGPVDQVDARQVHHQVVVADGGHRERGRGVADRRHVDGRARAEPGLDDGRSIGAGQDEGLAASGGEARGVQRGPIERDPLRDGTIGEGRDADDGGVLGHPRDDVDRDGGIGTIGRDRVEGGHRASHPRSLATFPLGTIAARHVNPPMVCAVRERWRSGPGSNGSRSDGRLYSRRPAHRATSQQALQATGDQPPAWPTFVARGRPIASEMKRAAVRTPSSETP